MATPPASKYPVEDAGPLILGATLTVTILALITLAARLFVRLNMIRNVGWDDYIMCMAMALCIAGQCIIIPQVKYGAGRHIDQIPPEHIMTALKLNFVTQPIYLVAIGVVKLSVGMFLLRIAIGSFYRRLITSIMVFMGIYTIACFFTLVLQCTNLAILWDPSVNATCWSRITLLALSYTNTLLSVITDLLFAIIIPIPMIIKIQMNRRKKASLICIMGLGIFATAAALIKAIYISSYGKEGDWLWDSRNLTIWTVIESNVGIIAGSLPCLKPLFKSVLGSTYGLGSRKYANQNYGLSGAYGTNKSGNMNYNSLTSKGTRTQDPDEALMMGTMAAKSRVGASPEPAIDGYSSKNSADSVDLIIQGGVKMGGITKTTEVKTEYVLSRSSTAEEEIDVVRPERHEAHIV